MNEINPNRRVGEEARKTYAQKLSNGFINRYLSGKCILDIGYRGYVQDVVPIVPQAIGIELDYPGYDGRTLPFGDETQDALFVSHCLEHIDDVNAVLKDWFRVMRVGGFLLIMVPHQYLYEKKLNLPSRWNEDHKRFYTPGSLMLDIENTLEPNTYRVRHLIDNDVGFDYSIPPESHSGGSYEIELVIEKIAQPLWKLDGAARPLSSRTKDASDYERELIPEIKGFVAQSFAPAVKSPLNILIIKLDHLGDFIVGLPALKRMRRAFPNDRLILICGPWNAQMAVQSGLFDDIRSFAFFPQNARNWNRQPESGLHRFKELVGGNIDIAIDLRVDPDTRLLLEHVPAKLRCGIGSLEQFPFLNIAMPPGNEEHGYVRDAEKDRFFDVSQFRSRMLDQTPFFHRTRIAGQNDYIIDGPRIELPLGRFKASFWLEVEGILGLRGAAVLIEVMRDGEIVRQAHLKRRRHARLESAGELDFTSDREGALYEFRVHVAGHAPVGLLVFGGVRLTPLWSKTIKPYKIPSQLHIGEQLSLLVELVSERTHQLYSDDFLKANTDVSSTVTKQLAALPASRPRIMIAPVSNSEVRDWPLDYYSKLVEQLVRKFDFSVILLGAADQATALQPIAESFGARVLNLAGMLKWSDLPNLLRQADLIICNNSGMAHLSASLGVRTLAIYSGSHKPSEWGPRGEASKTITAQLTCSPCGYEQIDDCLYNHICMEKITPEMIVAEVTKILEIDGVSVTA